MSRAAIVLHRIMGAVPPDFTLLAVLLSVAMRGCAW